MAVVGGHNADHLKTIFAPGLLLSHLLPGSVAAVGGDVQRGSEVPAAVGIRGKNAGHQRIAVVEPGCITMGLTDIRPWSTSDYAEPYFSLWLIRCFRHDIILKRCRGRFIGLTPFARRFSRG